MRSFDIVVAADEHLGIAKDGDLPWHLPGDLKHFRNTTTQVKDGSKKNAVVMGRKTWDSIPSKYRPLPGRLNIVLTRNEALQFPQGVMAFHSLEGALCALGEGALADDIEGIFVVGGGRVYEQSLEMNECQSLIITRIHKSFDCDTNFPHFEKLYVLETILGEHEENGVPFRIERWIKA